MDSILNAAVESVKKSLVAYCKFITPNDTGATKSHQYGYHIHKSAWSLFLEEPGIKGDNLEKWVKIKWQNAFETQSRFIYYGKKTRNEYRITQFGRGFPFLTEENIGNLLIINKIHEAFYEAYVLNGDDEIEGFLASVGISITDTNQIIPKSNVPVLEKSLQEYFEDLIKSLQEDFPASEIISKYARFVVQEYLKLSPEKAVTDPDAILLNWLDFEYQIFKSVENDRYSKYLHTQFTSVDELVDLSNTILNRRKSRAGKSLENHLSEVFKVNKLKFETQVITEQNKRPDFIFPGAAEYHNKAFHFSGLTFLGAKTTCKDRWRQVISEADRIPVKHLFTLQQGVSRNQLLEMKKENVVLVSPRSYIKSFPEEFWGDIMSLASFISYVREKQK
jgi:hypothetical protein